MSKGGMEELSFFRRAKEIGHRRLEMVYKTGDFLVGLMAGRNRAQREVYDREKEKRESEQARRMEAEEIENILIKLDGRRLLADYSAGLVPKEGSKEYKEHIAREQNFFLRDPRKTYETLGFKEEEIKEFESEDIQKRRAGVIGRHIIELSEAGEPLDVRDREGNIIGNWAVELSKTLEDKGFDDLGFNESEIAILKSSSLYPPVDEAYRMTGSRKIVLEELPLVREFEQKSEPTRQP